MKRFLLLILHLMFVLQGVALAASICPVGGERFTENEKFCTKHGVEIKSDATSKQHPSCSDMVKSGEFGKWRWSFDSNINSFRVKTSMLNGLKNFREQLNSLIIRDIDFNYINTLNSNPNVHVAFGKKISSDEMKMYNLRIDVDGKKVSEKKIDHFIMSYEGSEFEDIVKAFENGQMAVLYLMYGQGYTYKVEFSLDGFNASFKKVNEINEKIRQLNCRSGLELDAEEFDFDPLSTDLDEAERFLMRRK